MTDDWSQETSEIYRQLAAVAVPSRAEQIAALLTLAPFAPDTPFKVVELASGEGLLSQAFAQAFPQAQLLALDYEASMRAATAARLGNRGTVAPFDIRADDWFEHLDGADLVVSSLCIHHLDGDGKRRLFDAVAALLSPCGAFLIADLIAPTTTQANRLFAATWDAAARDASIEQTGSDELFAAFEREHWNLFHYPEPDFDKPSPLFEQLAWLKAAGFAQVDCFWMHAGHAIYGGYHADHAAAGLTYDRALTIARAVLDPSA